MGKAMTWLMNAIRSDTDDCLVYPFSPSCRYGMIYTPQNRQMLVHRLAYELTVGPIDADKEIRHLCGEAKCVNPRHLKQGTHAENEADKRQHGTAYAGERHDRAKLTEEDVRAIRSSTLATKALARHYGVAPSTVREARRGSSWKHIV